TTASGSIELANMRFQEAVDAPTTDPVIGAAPTTDPQSSVTLGPSSTSATPATAAPLTKPSAAVSPDATIDIDGTAKVSTKNLCTDRTAPDAHLRTLSYRGGLLSLSGWATDVGCKGTNGKRSVAGSVERVIVTVERVQGRTCKYLGPDGKLGVAASCK